MKTKEELTALKNEVEALNKKLAELSEDELAQVIGGIQKPLPKDYYENVILGTPNQGQVCAQTYRKEIGSDKNAKIIYT